MADTLDTIDGILASIKFHAPSKYDPAGRPFLIGRLSNGSTVKGHMRDPKEGQSYRFWGEWKDDAKGYGAAFQFIQHEPIIERSAGGVAAYLAMHVDGVGPAKAERIVETFGDDALDVLRRSPERLAEVPGLTDAVRESIREHFADHLTFDPAAYAALVELLDGYRVGKRTIEKILKALGSDALSLVREKPYVLLGFPRMGWQTVDAIATGRLGYDPEGLDRHAAAVIEALDIIAMDGHTISPRPEVERVATGLVGMPLHPSAVVYLRGEEELVPGMDDYGPTLALASLMDAERAVAEMVATLAMTARPIEADLATDDMGDDQRRAAELVREHGVAIVAGPPGVGKSWTIARIVGRLQENGVKAIQVVAPTGKAAKRAAELLRGAGVSGVESSTIHRALGVGVSDPDEGEGVPADLAKKGRGRSKFGFQRNESNPLECSVLIVDESSMVDCRLAASLLRAVAPGTRVIFVGDQHQLPSVGPGSVLRDLIAGGVPTAYLEQIRRSDGGGSVVKACHSIIRGQVPEPARKVDLPTHNWIHVEEASPAEVAQIIVGLHTKPSNDPRFEDRVWSRQVISPQKRRLPVACDHLNRLLADALNPGAPVGADEDGPTPPFRVGDKVIRTKNGKVQEMRPVDGRGDDGHSEAAGGEGETESASDALDDFSAFLPIAGRKADAASGVDLWWRGRGYQLVEGYAVNGDMGEVLDIVEGAKGRHAVVRLREPDRLVRLKMDEHHLIQAYAISVHKSQGSGFPYTILPVSNAFFWNAKTNSGLWCRELAYTAISRAEQLLVTVGEWSSIVAAIGRKTVHQRRTSLAARIAESINREAMEVVR